MVDFGSGPYLTRREDNSFFDFEVDELGDLRTISGLGELQKDTAFFLAIELQDELGRRLDSTSRSRAKLVAEDVFLDDPRIESVVSISATESNEAIDRMEIVAEVNTGDGPIELVIPVEV